jgi:hypothetical protein
MPLLRSLWLLGNVALACEAFAEAERLLERSAATYREYGLPHELVWVLANHAAAAPRPAGRSCALEPLISPNDAGVQSGESRLGRKAMSLFHRLLYRLEMRHHIQAVLAYPQDSELVAAIEVLLSVDYKGDGRHFVFPQNTIKEGFVPIII